MLNKLSTGVLVRSFQAKLTLQLIQVSMSLHMLARLLGLYHLQQHVHLLFTSPALLYGIMNSNLCGLKGPTSFSTELRDGTSVPFENHKLRNALKDLWKEHEHARHDV
jgi:hypothetical protein